jgi:CheY-like chemotaxis protein
MRDTYFDFLRRTQITIDALSRSALSLIKVVAATLLVIWVISERNFVRDWVASVSHFEALGTKIDRQIVAEAQAQFDKLAVSQARWGVSGAIGEAAIARASRIAPAIVGGRVLWVDDKPGNNQIERGILQTLKIEVTLATSTTEALLALRHSRFDVVVSNVWRPNEPRETLRKLEKCPVHYFDFPDAKTRKDYERAGGLEAFNRYSNEHGPAGFSMIEQLVTEDQQTSVPVIFYSGRTADIARSMCGEKMTNRADVLLQTIVSNLEERRWNRLPERN